MKNSFWLFVYGKLARKLLNARVPQRLKLIEITALVPCRRSWREGGKFLPVRYVVKIPSLDGLETHEGVPAGDRIQFTRGAKTESIHAGSGQETGMKWLMDKKNCLIIKAGEGFCRE